jgi:hypothetical protein
VTEPVVLSASVRLAQARRKLDEARRLEAGIVERANSAIYGIEDMARKAGTAFTLEDQLQARDLAVAHLGIENVAPRIAECEEALINAMFDAGQLTAVEVYLTRLVPAVRAAVLGAGMITPPA